MSLSQVSSPIAPHIDWQPRVATVCSYLSEGWGVDSCPTTDNCKWGQHKLEIIGTFQLPPEVHPPEAQPPEVQLPEVIQPPEVQLAVTPLLDYLCRDSIWNTCQVVYLTTWQPTFWTHWISLWGPGLAPTGKLLLWTLFVSLVVFCTK